MIVAVVCRSFFFSGSCFCHCPMEVIFVELPFLCVVAGSCFFFNDSDTAVVSKKCCSTTGLYLLVLPLVCCFLLKKYFAVFV